MKVLVTGAGGFVGRYLCSYLRSLDHRVWGMGRHPSTLDNYIVADILDKPVIDSLVQEIQPDLLFHLAGFSSVKRSFVEAQLVHEINYEGTKNVIDALQKLSPQTRFLYVSSAVVYGNSPKTSVSEEVILMPNSPYAQSRVDVENLLREYNLPWIVARSFNHTGPGQSEEFVLSDWCRQVAAIELGLQDPTISVGNVESIRDFLDVRDIVRVYYALLKRGEIHSVYNVGSGVGYRLGDLLAKIIDFATVPVQVKVDQEKFRSQDTTLLVADIGKLSNILGPYSPLYSIDQTLRDILDYWRYRLKNNHPQRDL